MVPDENNKYVDTKFIKIKFLFLSQIIQSHSRFIIISNRISEVTGMSLVHVQSRGHSVHMYIPQK